MKQDRKFQGVWIPADLWLADGLSITEKCLLVEINSLDNDEERGCFASNEYLGKFLGLSAGRVANMISDLKKRSFIVQVYFDGRNRGLRLHENAMNLHENVKAVLTESLKLPSRKREHSNIDNNNSIEGENAPAQFVVKTIALETIPTVECEVPRPAARPASKVSDVQANPNAFSDAAEYFLRLIEDRKYDLGTAAKFAVPYFRHKQQTGKWITLCLPSGVQEEHRWLGEHMAGVRTWAENQVKFDRPGAQPTPQADVAPTMRLSNPENAPR